MIEEDKEERLAEIRKLEQPPGIRDLREHEKGKEYLNK